MDHHKLIPLWDERYNINHQKIDTQHQRLFEPAAQVENAVFKFVKRDELKEILTELFAYMKEHFHDEEEFMQEIQYPRLYEHKQMHKNIIHEMFQLIQNIKSTNDLKEKLSFNQSLLEVERIILLMEKDYQLYPFESFVSELKIHYSKEYYILMKLLEIVMKDCQEAKLGRETVKLTLSLMMNQKLRLKIFGF